MSHAQIKVKCLSCALHFIVCTWFPDRHTFDSLYCPECGQHSGNFALWKEDVAQHIHMAVPGNAVAIDRPRFSEQESSGSGTTVFGI